MSEIVNLKPDAAAALAFNELIRPGRPLDVTVLGEGLKGPLHQRFATSDEAALQAFLEDHNGQERQRNVYMDIAVRIDAAASAAKINKQQVGAITCLWVDIDPAQDRDFTQEREAILARLRSYTITPSVVVDSGGGFWAFWLLNEPIAFDGPTDPDRDRVERRLRGLANDLGGDHCTDLCRITRLPGSINWPNPKKQKRGQTPRVARLKEDF